MTSDDSDANTPYSVTVAVEESVYRSGELLLRVDGPGDRARTSYNQPAAEAVCQQFGAVMQFEHGLRDALERTDDDTLEKVEARFRKELLRERTGLVLNQECQRRNAKVELWIKGIPSHVNLPWEILSVDGRKLFDYNNVSVARTILGAPSPQPQAEQIPKLRVLFVPVQPEDQPPVYWREAIAEFDRRLWHYAKLGRIERDDLGYDATAANTLQRLRQQVQTCGPYDVVSLLAHGRYNPPQIALVGPDRKTLWTGIEELVPALTCGDRLPRAVLLGCCHLARVDPDGPYNGIAYQLLAQGVPAVLSMQSAVSSRGAAAATATVLRSALCGKGIGQAVLEARRAMPPPEAPLPVLWLNPSWSQHEPLVRVARSDRETLIAEANRMLATPNRENHAVEMLARMQYIEDMHGLVSDFERDLKLRYEEMVADKIVKEIRRLRQQEVEREDVAQQLSLLETRCPRLGAGGDDVKKARDWVTEPMDRLLVAGRRCQAQGQWDEALRRFEEAAARVSPDPHVDRFWQPLREKAELERQLARANCLKIEAERLRAAESLLEAVNRGTAALRSFRQLLQVAPRQFAYLQPCIDGLQQDLKAAEVLLQARQAMENFDWDTATRRLEEKAACQPRAIEEAADLEFVQHCRRVAEAAETARQHAEQGRWADALASLPDDTAPAPAAAQAPGGAEARRQALWLRWHASLGLAAHRQRWATACTITEMLEALESPLAVTCTSECSPPACHAFRLALGTPDVLAGAREELKAGLPTELVDWLVERLASDAPACFALCGDWDRASQAARRLGTAAVTSAAAQHRLAVAGMACARAAQSLHPHGETAARHGRESLRAWSEAWGCPQYWREWSHRHLPAGEEWSNLRLQRLIGEIRREVASQLVGQPDALSLLAGTRTHGYLSPSGAQQLTLLAVESAERMLARSEWDQVGLYWEEALRYADRAVRLGGPDAATFTRTCTAIFDAAVTWSELRGDDDRLARTCKLWDVAVVCLRGTERLAIAQHACARAHFLRGLQALERSYGEWSWIAYKALQQAHNLNPCEGTYLAIVLSLLLHAESLSDPSEIRRVRKQATEFLAKAREDRPASADLARMRELSEAPKLLEHPYFDTALSRILEGSAFTGKAAADLRREGEQSLADGDDFQAAFCLVHALWLGERVAVPAVRGAFEGLERRLLAGDTSGALPPPIDTVERWYQRAVACLADAQELEAWRRALPLPPDISEDFTGEPQ